MTEPRRLVEEGTEFERGVLASARLDVGGDDGLKRALVAGAATISATALASTAGAEVAAGTAGVAAGGAGTLLGSAGLGFFAKWTGVAAFVVFAGTAVTTASLIHRANPPIGLTAAPPPMNRLAPVRASSTTTFSASSIAPQYTESERPARVQALPVATGALPLHTFERIAPPAAPSRVVQVALEPEPIVTVVPSTPPAPMLSLSVQPRLPSSLDAEVATLDRVRLSLAERKATGALKELDAYDRAFPMSVLAEEATVLRVDALMEKGDRAAAAALSRRFLVANPASPHASHMWQVLSGFTQSVIGSATPRKSMTTRWKP
jgi:hypothetical protein